MPPKFVDITRVLTGREVLGLSSGDTFVRVSGKSVRVFFRVEDCVEAR
jgi:hypothetical protein